MLSAMSRTLDTARLTAAMQQVGLSQADLAKALTVSREAVSKWLSGEAVPRPDKLVRLGMLVKLRAHELIQAADTALPVIAFRKKGAAKTTQAHIQRAQEMGLLLRPLVAHLPFDRFVRPETLKSPSLEDDYLQALAERIRADMGVGPAQTLEFSHLVRRFANTQTVLVPVLWGKKGHHENALHILLPDSQTTWVFLNLDVEVHDFKFWMAHELGHVLAPELRGDEGEDFADALAGALLMPRASAQLAYREIALQIDDARRINALKAIAERMLISPYTVYLQVNVFARSQQLRPLQLEPAIHGACRNLSKGYYSVSQALFGTDGADPKALVTFAREQLDSPFFEAVSAHLRATRQGPGYLQSVMDIPALDAIELHKILA
jgi:transcriptional regulator with XRE-family HTH domain